jgi:hypothetical protein
VIYGQAELIHVRCHFGWSPVGQRIAAFLRLNDDREFCHTCLTASLQIPYEELRKAVTGLRAMREVVVKVSAACSHCRAPRVTLSTSRTGILGHELGSLTGIIRTKLATGSLPRRLTERLGPDTTAVKPRIIGRGAGKLCSVCDTVIEPGDGQAQEFVSATGRVTRFHRVCYDAWNEERRRAASRPDAESSEEAAR